MPISIPSTITLNFLVLEVSLSMLLSLSINNTTYSLTADVGRQILSVCSDIATGAAKTCGCLSLGLFWFLMSSGPWLAAAAGLFLLQRVTVARAAPPFPIYSSCSVSCLLPYPSRYTLYSDPYRHVSPDVHLLHIEYIPRFCPSRVTCRLSQPFPSRVLGGSRAWPPVRQR